MADSKSDMDINEVVEPKAPPPNPAPQKPERREIPLEKIRTSEFCQRSSYDDLDSLTGSVEQHGLLQPVGVTEDGDGCYTLIFGSRRYLAHKRLGKQTIRCLVFKVAPDEAAILSFTENDERSELSPVEQARKWNQAIERFGWEPAEFADKIHRPKSVVDERLAILRLGDDILAKVGNRPCSPFNFSHALALSKLINTDRFNREVEVRELQNKTIEFELSSTELKKLVELFKDGDFDLLPDNLRTYLLKSKAMTANMARLYLRPEEAIKDTGQRAQQMREMAQRLSKEERKDFIAKAVKAEQSHDVTCRKLTEMVERRLKDGDKEEASLHSGLQRLISDMSVLERRLTTGYEGIRELAKSNPKRLGILRRAIQELQKKLEPIETLMRDTVNKNKLDEGELVKESENVSIG